MSLGELLVILVVALIVFGPDKLPQLAGHLGQLFNKAQQLREQLHQALDLNIKQQQLEENRRKAEAAESLSQQKPE